MHMNEKIEGINNTYLSVEKQSYSYGSFSTVTVRLLPSGKVTKWLDAELLFWHLEKAKLLVDKL